jgi:hypothetical protein
MEQPYGGPLYPLTSGQVVDIFRMYSDGVMSEANIDRVIDIVLDLDRQPNLRELFGICTFPNRTQDAARNVTEPA